MEIYNIETGNFKCDGGAMFGVIPKVMWRKKYPSNDDNYCDCSMRSMLVVIGDKRILIDTGCGNKQGEKFFKHAHLFGDNSLIKSIKKAGYTPDDITDVFFTHLHYDHCGGAVRWNNDKTGYELVFKNAQHWVSKVQWENYLNPNIREGDSYFKENVMPIFEANRLNFVEDEGELFPNFEVRFFHGHTYGLMVPIINNNGNKIVFASDFIPTVANIGLKWIASYDLFPTKVLKEKAQFLNEAVSNNYTLFLQHDFYNECCTLTKSEKGIVADKIFTLQ